MNAVSGRYGIIRFGVSPIKAHAVFAEELSYITDRKLFFEKILQFLGSFSSRNGDFLHHSYEITGRAVRRQECNRAIFAIL